MWAASITGHLGPGAPAEHDGQVFVGTMLRQQVADLEVHTRRLQATDRVTRQEEAVLWMMRFHSDCDHLELEVQRWLGGQRHRNPSARLRNSSSGPRPRIPDSVARFVCPMARGVTAGLSR